MLKTMWNAFFAKREAAQPSIEEMAQVASRRKMLKGSMAFGLAALVPSWMRAAEIPADDKIDTELRKAAMEAQLSVASLETRVGKLEDKTLIFTDKIEILGKKQDEIEAMITAVVLNNRALHEQCDKIVAICLKIGTGIEALRKKIDELDCILNQIRCILAEVNCILCQLPCAIQRAKVRAFILGVIVGVGIGAAVGGGGGGAGAASVSIW